MNDLDELERFRADVAQPSPAAWAGARSALAGAIREERIRRRRPHLGFRLAAVASVAAAALVVLVAVLVAGNSSPSPAHRTHASGRPGAAHSPAPLMRLADYKFALPAGFKTVATACAPVPRRPHQALTVMQGFSAAASADGGCVEAELSAGATVVPPQANPVAVGSYQGFMLVTSPTSETLYVAIPAAAGDHYLVLTAVGISEEQLVDIAAAGLPESSGPPTTCTSGCG